MRRDPQPGECRSVSGRLRAWAAPRRAAKPSFAASRSRASAWATGRSAPERLTSPKNTASRGQRHVLRGRRPGRGDREIGGGLGDAQAAGDVEVDVASRRSRCRSGTSSTASIIASRPPSQPTTVRRAVPSADGRHQRLDLDEHRPGALDAGEDGRAGDARLALGEEEGRGVGAPRRGRRRSSRRRRSRRRGRSGSSPRAGCGTGGRARPRSRATVSTMCSTTRGPAIWPSLVTWPTRTTALPRRLGEAGSSSCAAARTWATEPGALSTCVGPHGLDRIDDRQAGALGLERGRGCRGGWSRRRAARGASPRPRRAARMRIWSTASSPET